MPTLSARKGMRCLRIAIRLRRWARSGKGDAEVCVRREARRAEVRMLEAERLWCLMDAEALSELKCAAPRASFDTCTSPHYNEES